MSSGTPTRLFVYGTLRRDPSHDMFHLLARAARFLGEAEVQGRLYDLGAYPGMTLTNDDRLVKGELYEIHSERWQETIRQLDEYEGCSEADHPPHEYRRELVDARLETGERLSAWSYVLNRPSASLPKISSGDYLSVGTRTA
jgi:gamma-glutamylcyclotransferase (GGCT)/AIG2-like uncharacterized protein YtfP